MRIEPCEDEQADEFSEARGSEIKQHWKIVEARNAGPEGRSSDPAVTGIPPVRRKELDERGIGNVLAFRLSTK